MSIPALSETHPKVPNESISEQAPSKGQRNLKAASLSLTILITSVVLLVLFSNPFLIALGAILMVGGLAASDHFFWGKMDSKLASIRKSEGSSTNQIGPELGRS
jgi:hypothetical protein